MAYSVTKTGQFVIPEIEEYVYEPDGSIWQHVFHQADAVNNMFSSTDTFTTGFYKNNNAWFNFNICNKISTTWEFLILQQQTEKGVLLKYRWQQSANPFTATFANVAAANITKNISSGYTDFSTGGLYKKNSNAFFTTNDGTSSHWYGAIGAWALNGSSVPAWDKKAVTTGSIDVYVRVDSLIRQANISKLGIVTAGGQFYEY